VTKPTATAPGKQIKDTISNAPHVIPVVKSPEPPVADEIEPQKEKDELDEPRMDEDSRALRVTEADIKKYWIEEERSRSAPRGMSLSLSSCVYIPVSIDMFLPVHQKELDLDEKILRHFDLSTQYGVCFHLCYCYNTERLANAWNLAVYRYLKNPTMAKSPHARAQPADRGPGCSAERAKNTGKRTGLCG
jgi:hypothetical protein